MERSYRRRQLPKGAEAFLQNRTAEKFGTDGIAAVSNSVQAAGYTLNLWGTPRITNNNIFVFLNGATQKAVFRQNRVAVEETQKNETNSDRARDFDEEGIGWRMRAGFGVALPLMTGRIA